MLKIFHGRSAEVHKIPRQLLTKRTPFQLSLMFGALFSLTACSGGGDNSSEAPIDDLNEAPPKYTGLPIPQNQDVADYKILYFGNSHVAGQPELIKTLIENALPNKTVVADIAPGLHFLAERLDDPRSMDMLLENEWTHLVLQGQKYSQSGGNIYPTDAAESWITVAKQSNITPILFPEHPQLGNAQEGQYVYDIHTTIASNQRSCVSPIGPAWDKALAIDSSLDYYYSDGNHAAPIGSLLTAYVFYEVITGQPADLIPDIDELGIDKETQSFLRQVATETLLELPACEF